MITAFSLEAITKKLSSTAITAIFKIAATLIVIIIGLLIAKLIKNIIRKALEKADWDISLEHFISRAVDICLKIIILISALSALGVSTTGIIAAFSAAAVAISLALKDSLGNMAGGILMLITRPFSTGDYIEVDGYSGTVLQIDMIHTTLRTPDNRQVVIPNGQLVNKTITDYSKESTRRLDLKFSISYDNDSEKAKAIIFETVEKHELALKDPEPFVRVSGHGESSIAITLRVWVESPNYWTLHFDLLEQVKDAFDKNGITIPYNQLDVHVIDSK